MMNDSNRNHSQVILSQRFAGAVEFLKKQTINQRQKLFHLPWYFILNTASADKNDILEHSNLEFILRKKKESNSFNYCDWWGTKQAILVDINPQFCNIPEDKALHQSWHEFLELCANAKKQAIDALWIIVDLPCLLKEQKEDQKALAIMLKNRIKDLQKNLNAQFPIYMIVSRVDVLKGFVEFFDDLNNHDREQAWGMQFNAKQASSSQNLADAFETEFTDLLKAINARVINRLHHERNINKRVNIKDFPLQMESIKKPIAAFLQNFGEYLTIKTKTPLRGIYFCSVEPKNIIEDRLLPPLLKAFSLQRVTDTEHITPQKDYFIKELFSNVLIPDAQRFHDEPSQTNQPQHRWLRRTAISLATLAVISATGYFVQDYLQGNTILRQTDAALAQYQAVDETGHHDVLRNNLIALNKLLLAYQASAQTALNTFKTKQNSVAQLPQAAQIAYHDALNNLVTTQFIDLLNTQVKQEAPDPELLYGALKAYIMLSEPKHFDPRYVQSWLTNYWHSQSSLSANEQAELAEHLQFFIKNYHSAIPLNQNLVMTARQKLSAIPTAQLINVILSNNSNQPMLTIAVPGEQSAKAIFAVANNAITVPGIYTKDAFEHIYDEVLPQTAADLQQGDWVTGRQGFGIAMDKDTLMQIRQQYVDNYIHTWDNVIGQLQLVQINSYDQALDIIQALTKPAESIVTMMRVIYENTNISYHNVATPVSEHFANLDKVIYYFKNSHNENILALASFIQGIASDSNRSIAAFEFVKGQAVLPTRNVFDGLNQVAQAAPTPVNQWIKAITQDTWHLILADCAVTVNAAWQNNVYNYFNKNLANNYPFNPQAKQDASLQDFNKFFAKDGVYNEFYNLYLADFVTTKDNRLVLKDFYGQTLPLTPDALNSILALDSIVNSFYSDENPSSFAFHFTLAPEKFSPNAKSVDLNLDEQAATYSSTFMDPTKFVWPTHQEQHFASVTFTSNDGNQQSTTLTGPWAVFKLLKPEDTKLIQHNQNTVETHLDVNNYNLAYAITTENAANPFAPDVLIGLALPPSLLKSSETNAG